jgi:NADH dehydrogenase
VEVAGMLAEMIKKVGAKEYPEIEPGTFRIYLVQHSPVLLKPMSEKAQREALSVLTKLGVIVMLHTAVKDYIDGKVVLDNGETIPTNALLWTSGVVGREVKGLPPETYGYGRRLIVDAYCKVKGTGNIFAIGDISLSLEDPKYPGGHPQLAQTAIQQGKALAENFKRSSENRACKPFAYNDKGTMAIISKYKAVADLRNVFFKGYPAWLAWLFIHLIPIAGFKNKFDLVTSWAWAFITNNPTLRLIIRPQAQEYAEENKTKANDRPAERKITEAKHVGEVVG